MEADGLRFVLVHGGWQSGWCWDGVRDALTHDGHEVFVATWLGDARDPAPPPGSATVTASGDAVVRQIDAAGLGDDLVLVGHSGGGPVIQRAADRLLGRVRRLVFVNAWVLTDGESIADLVPGVAGLRAVADADPDRRVAAPSDWWSGQLMNGAAESLIEQTIARLVPLPFEHLDQPISLPHLWSAGLPASYVFLRDDISVDPAIYRRMSARLNAPRIVRCEGPHEAMLTHPDQLAKALIEAA